MSQQLIYTPEQEEVFFDQIDQVYALAEDLKFEEAEQLLLEIEDSILDPKENCSVGGILLDSIFAFYEQAGQVEKALPYFIKETDYLQEKIKTESIKSISHFITTGAIYYALADLELARKYFKLAHKSGKSGDFQDYNPDFLHIALISDAEFIEFSRDFVPQTNMDQEDLSEEQQELIDDYSEKGNLAMDNGEYTVAISWFTKAMEVLPEPAGDWEASGWLSASIGDAYFSAGKYKQALENLHSALQIYGEGEDANPFVLLRLGETYFELNDHKKATDYLLLAYKMEGEAIFEEEKKYLNFLKKQTKL